MTQEIKKIKKDEDDDNPSGYEEGRIQKDVDIKADNEENDIEEINIDDFEFKEIITRKVDLELALQNEERSKTAIHRSRISKVPKNIQNGRIRIPKNITDSTRYGYEDENDYSYAMIFDPMIMQNNLVNYLSNEEKVKLNQQKMIDQKSLDNAEKLGAINKVTKELNKIGIKPHKKELNKAMNNAIFNKTTKDLLTKDVITNRLKINTKGLKLKDTEELISGIKRIKEMGGEAKGLKLKDVTQAGKKSTENKEVAKIIYENAKGNDKQKIDKAVSKNIQKTIGEKTGRTSNIKETLGMEDKDKVEKTITEISKGRVLKKNTR